MHPDDSFRFEKPVCGVGATAAPDHVKHRGAWWGNKCCIPCTFPLLVRGDLQHENGARSFREVACQMHTARVAATRPRVATGWGVIQDCDPDRVRTGRRVFFLCYKKTTNSPSPIQTQHLFVMAPVIPRMHCLIPDV
jgi:hypothetical protein